MGRYFNIWLMQLKNGLSQRMVYPINFLMMCLGVFLSMSMTIIFIHSIFGFVDQFAGWSRSEAMVVVATYMIIEGFLWATVACLGGVAINVRTGFFDILLTKPINTQFLVSVWRADPEDWVRVIVAAFVLFFNVPALSLSNNELLINGLGYIFFVFNAYMIVYSVFLVVKTISFWLIEVRSLHHIGESIIQSSKYPIDIFFHKIVRIIFSTAIPLAFIATVPAQVMIHGPKLGLMIYSTLIAVIFFYLSRRFFLLGLKHYESASS